MKDEWDVMATWKFWAVMAIMAIAFALGFIVYASIVFFDTSTSRYWVEYRDYFGNWNYSGWNPR